MRVNDVRKNFVFKKEVSDHLAEIAKREGKSMTKIIEELVEKKYMEVSKEEKLKALNDFFELTKEFNIPKGTTIQSIKANRDAI